MRIRIPAQHISSWVAATINFVCSIMSATAIDECVGDEKDALLLGEFETKRDLTIIDFTRIPGPSFWMENWQEDQFLHSFNREITKKLAPKDKNLLQYVPTQLFTEFLHYMFTDGKGLRLDGMIYGSSKRQQKNIVLFCNQRESENFIDVTKIVIE